jgi:hypothetical protein
MSQAQPEPNLAAALLELRCELVEGGWRMAGKGTRGLSTILRSGSVKTRFQTCAVVENRTGWFHQWEAPSFQIPCPAPVG